MAREGQHSAEVKITGDTRSSVREVKALETRISVLEEKLGKAAVRADNFEKALHKKNNALGSVAGQVFNAGMKIAGWVATVQMASTAVDAFTQHTLRTSNLMRNLPYSIDAAKKSTMGLIGTTKLSELAIRAQQSGIARTSEEFDRLSTAATKLGLKLGIDVVEANERLIMGLAKQEREILDELGLVETKMIPAQTKYAKSLGLTVSQLTEAQKAHAFNSSVIAEAERKANDAEVAVDGLAGAWLRAKVAAEEWYNTTTNQTVRVESDAQKIADAFRHAGDEGRYMLEHVAFDKLENEIVGRTGMQQSNAALRKLEERFEALGLEADNTTEIIYAARSALKLLNREALDASKALAMQGAEALQKALVTSLEQQVLELEKSEIAMGNIEGSEMVVTALATQRRKILANLASARGDEAEAAKLEAESIKAMVKDITGGLKPARQQGESAAMRRWKIMLSEAQVAKSIAEMSRERANWERQIYEVQQKRASMVGKLPESMGRFSEENVERTRANEAISLSRLGRDQELAERAIQDPGASVFGAVNDAAYDHRLALLDREEEMRSEYLRRELARTDDRIEQDSIRDQIEQLHHEKRLERLDIEGQRQEAHAERIYQLGQKATGAAANVANQWISIPDARFRARQAALAQGKTEAEAGKAAQQAAQMQKAAILDQLSGIAIQKAAFHGAEAIGAFARYDFVSGGLHLAAAAAFSGIAIGTKMAARSIERRVAGDQRQSSLAEQAEKDREQEKRGQSRGGSSGGGSRSESGIPPSVPPGTSTTGGPGPAPVGQRTHSGLQVGAMHFHVLGSIDQKSAREISRGLRELRLSEGEAA